MAQILNYSKYSLNRPALFQYYLNIIDHLNINNTAENKQKYQPKRTRKLHQNNCITITRDTHAQV